MDGWMDGWTDGDVTIRQKENIVLNAKVGIKICRGYSEAVQSGACYISEVKCLI